MLVCCRRRGARNAGRIPACAATRWPLLDAVTSSSAMAVCSIHGGDAARATQAASPSMLPLNTRWPMQWQPAPCSCWYHRAHVVALARRAQRTQPHGVSCHSIAVARCSAQQLDGRRLLVSWRWCVGAARATQAARCGGEQVDGSRLHMSRRRRGARTAVTCRSVLPFNSRCSMQCLGARR